MGLVKFTGASVAADVEYGLGLLASFGVRVDVVGVYTGSPGVQVFPNARPMKALLRESSHMMEYPVESGQTFSDYHIIMPVEIDIPMIVEQQYYAATYADMRDKYLNATALSVKTRTGVYSNMVIADMPHVEDPEMYTAITFDLRLKEVLLYQAGTNQLQPDYQPLSVLNSNTIASGLQSVAAIGTKLLTAATAALSYATLVKRL